MCALFQGNKDCGNTFGILFGYFELAGELLRLLVTFNQNLEVIRVINEKGIVM